MFSSKSQLKNRTPENGTDRENYLSLLVDEYLHSASYDAKCQVLANLANFAYDPINYNFIRDVGVLDIFLHVLKKETDHTLLHFAVAGICNCCLDPLNAEYILTNAGLKPLIIALLKTKNNIILSDIITTLIYLYNEHTQAEIRTPEVVELINDLKNTNDKKVANLAAMFIQKVCVD